METETGTLPSQGATSVTQSAGRALNEPALIDRAKAGDETAFREIVERYQSQVLSVIHRIVRDRNDAEDIAQEVFASVFFSLPAFESRSSLRAWIYRIAVNESYEYLRRRKVRPLVYESELISRDEDKAGKRETFPSPQPGIDHTLVMRDFVVQLLARVSDYERWLLVMKEVEGYSILELAQMTGLNESTVKVRIFRARRKMMKAAERRFGITLPQPGLGVLRDALHAAAGNLPLAQPAV